MLEIEVAADSVAAAGIKQVVLDSAFSPRSATCGRFRKLMGKYASVLNLIGQLGVRLQNLHMQDNKLFLRGHAKRKAESNRVWDQIKLVNPNYVEDLVADLTYDANGPARPPEPSQPANRTYTVKVGDTLSKIAKQYYGDSGLYRRIFEANRQVLRDPDHIQVGQVLQIPE